MWRDCSGASLFNGTAGTPGILTDKTDPLGQWNPAGGAGYASLRNAQAHTLALPKTFQAVILDTPCSSGSVHSPYKQPVGSRLARQALATEYAQAQPSPIASAVAAAAGKITVTVGGLTGGASLEALPTSSVYGFEALGTDGIWHSTRKCTSCIRFLDLSDRFACGHSGFRRRREHRHTLGRPGWCEGRTLRLALDSLRSVAVWMPGLREGDCTGLTHWRTRLSPPRAVYHGALKGGQTGG